MAKPKGIREIMLECTAVVKSHYRLWGWLFVRRVRASARHAAAGFVPFA